MILRVVRVEPDGLTVVLNRLPVGVLELFRSADGWTKTPGVATFVVGRSEVTPEFKRFALVEPDGFGQVGDRPIVVLLLCPRITAEGERYWVVRVKPNGRVIVLYGPIVVLLLCPGTTSAEVVIRVLLSQPDGLIVVCDRAVVVLPDRPGMAAAGIRVSVFRIEPNGLVEVGDRTIVI